MEELIKTGDEIGKKLCESCIKFCEQKKDMLSLLKGGENDRGYNDELESIIQQIDDEDQESKIKIIKEGEEKEKMIYNKYKSFTIFEHNQSEIMKEKIKKDIMNSINTLILK